MKLERFALIAEIVGSVAIVVTLIVLIVEMRENTDEIRATTLADIAARTQALPLAAATNPEQALLWIKIRSGEGLSPSDFAQAHQMLIVTLKLAEESFIAHRDERLDDEVWQTRAAIALIYLERQDLRNAWEDIRKMGVYIPGFVGYIDTAIADRE